MKREINFYFLDQRKIIYIGSIIQTMGTLLFILCALSLIYGFYKIDLVQHQNEISEFCRTTYVYKTDNTLIKHTVLSFKINKSYCEKPNEEIICLIDEKIKKPYLGHALYDSFIPYSAIYFPPNYQFKDVVIINDFSSNNSTNKFCYLERYLVARDWFGKIEKNWQKI